MNNLRDLILELKKANIRISVEKGDLRIHRAGTQPIEQRLDLLIGEHKGALIGYVNQIQQSRFNTIPKAPVQVDYPVSSSQRRLWILSQLDGGDIAYGMPLGCEFEGTLDRRALERSFAALIERHEILRTLFGEDEHGEIRQIVQSPEDTGFTLFYLDLRGEEAPQERVRESVQQEIAAPFDLDTGPLLRANLYQVTDTRWVFFYNMHHIIGDRWSMDIVIDELLMFYNAYARGEAPLLPPLRIQYKDYAVWQQDQLSGEQFRKHKDYWEGQFKGELPVLNMPTDRVRPAQITYNGNELRKWLGPVQSRGLKSLGQQQGATLFMSSLALVNTLLYRYTGEQDIIVGLPVAGREHADLEGQIGFYVNILPIRTKFRGEYSFVQLLGEVRRVSLEAYEHQAYPFDELIRHLVLARDASRNLLFDVMVIVQSETKSESRLAEEPDGLKAGRYEADGAVSKFDLTFHFVEEGDDMQLNIQYNTDLFEKSTIERMIAHLEQLLKTILERPSAPIRQLDYLRENEKQQLTEAATPELQARLKQLLLENASIKTDGYEEIIL